MLYLYCTRSGIACTSGLERLEYLEHRGRCVNGIRLRCKCCPSAWIWTEATHKVVYLLGIVVPLNLACLLKYLWSRQQFHILVLWLRRHIAICGKHHIYCILTYLGTKLHQSIVYILYIRIVGNGKLALSYDTTCIYIMIEEEGGDTCLCLTIYHSPVDWSCTTILRK